jgi:hypothetical protein
MVGMTYADGSSIRCPNGRLYCRYYTHSLWHSTNATKEKNLRILLDGRWKRHVSSSAQDALAWPDKDRGIIISLIIILYIRTHAWWPITICYL